MGVAGRGRWRVACRGAAGDRVVSAVGVTVEGVFVPAPGGAWGSVVFGTYRGADAGRRTWFRRGLARVCGAVSSMPPGGGVPGAAGWRTSANEVLCDPVLFPVVGGRTAGQRSSRNCSDGYDDGVLFRWEGARGFLVFCPHPRGDGFFYVVEGLLLVLALRDAAGKRGAFDDDPSVFGGFHGDVEDHGCT